MSYATPVIFIALILATAWFTERTTRRHVARSLRERSEKLTIQARVELKTIADELEGKR